MRMWRRRWLDGEDFSTVRCNRQLLQAGTVCREMPYNLGKDLTMGELCRY